MSVPLRRARIPIMGALASALALSASLLTAGSATAAPPAQEPGITLRTFDLQTALSNLCNLKPAQTPNVDKLMPTINWTTAADFGQEDNFYTQAIGNISIATAGTYAFRLISDDGSRLIIDDSVVINHDGLHGASAKDGSVALGTGYHSLHIDFFEAGGGQQLTLQWQPPGATSFVTLPTSVLSTDAGVVRVTAPGRKECETAGDSPGDGLPLTAVHPNFTLTNLRPAGFQPKVTGMDWLPDGRLVISTWGGDDQSGTSQAGEVFILSGTGGTTGNVTTKRIASALKEPMGLKVVDGVVYVSEKQRLTRLVDTNGDEVADQYQTVATWPYGGNFHEFAFGLLYQDGFFYVNLSVSINYGGNTTNPQPIANRGTTIKIDASTGAISYLAGGLRTPHGIGWGPENGIFVTDNQGGYQPASKLVHIKQGRFFNHYLNPQGPFDNAPTTQPVMWMPQNEIGNSPSTPLYMPSGLYAGQFLVGDVTYGGLQRAFVEKINGEYQGAYFRLTQGLEAGVSEVALGPDGAVYVGGLGAGGNWGQSGKLLYGLQKLTPNGNNHFDMLAMRATSTGFEIEYTQPLSAATATALASKYRVKQWRYVPTAAYGGPKIDEETLSVTSATLSPDGKKVNLVISGLKAGRVVHVRSPRPFAAANGQSLWSTEAWYTLNAVPGQTPPVNLALGRPATSDSNCSTSEVAARAVNGTANNGNLDKWCSQGASKWLQVDLGSTQTVNRVVLQHAGAGGENTAWNTRDFNVQVSTNGTTWTTVATVTGNTASVTTHNLAPVPARYVRVNVTTPASDGNAAARVYELEVYGGTSTAGNLALNKAATADSSCAAAEAAAKAVNGSVSGGNADKWCSLGASKWLQVDLGAAQTVGRVVLKHAGAGGENSAWNTRDFNLQVSTDGTAWTTVATVTGNTLGSTTHVFTPTQARYIRLNVTTPASDGNAAARVYELEAYSSAGANPGRVVLFDGANLDNFEQTAGGAATWPLGNGGAEVFGGDIRSKEAFGDFRLHIEFWLPNLPPEVTGQARANSGIYLQDRYELQVLDSYGDTSIGIDECASIYNKIAPTSNAATAPQTWQTYDVTFRAARYNASGTKTENARVTVVWNGVTVHNNVAIDGPTGAGAAEGPAAGRIRLQDHGDPGANLFYRNIWVEPLAL
ncbi:discoidin domain-containing protein [Dactylosporangium sp. AC04546]|uniref:discoidin domain-containing protein n=1 Tax=Dactylosporangium sp. AC04546 TaxID=2862460 RepID=UPI001EDCA248|nr:discoidin domain-containing protein [Dactylosporangium sp. AC04546]WVK79292.1 discoidin domain-containing protein [Dactylosporangium sp. AC04546]